MSEPITIGVDHGYTATLAQSELLDKPSTIVTDIGAGQ